VRVPPTVEGLLALSRAGQHAASDHLETAALAGVETVGCRRCGGGLAGAVAVSNVLEGARVASDLDPDIVVFDGSGAAIPPVDTARRVLVVGAHQDPAVATGYLNAYRAALADLVVVTMAEPDTPHAELAASLGGLVRPGVQVVRTRLRARPMTSVAGQRVAYFCTAPAERLPEIAASLADEHGADVVHVSGALANRATLHEELRGLDAETFLVELKAAAVDVVVEAAVTRGARVVLAANDVVPLAGEPSLDSELERLAREAIAVSGERAGQGVA
jgi:cyclic 2,3-diphosphoglycerate synthetase